MNIKNVSKVDDRFADKIGAEYELFPLAAPHYKEFQKIVAELAAGHPTNQEVLEIGCGTGLTTLEIVKLLPSSHIVALDAEQVMVDQATKNLEEYGNIDVVCADALEHLQSLESSSLDVIATAFCLHNTPPEYRQKVFVEMGRVLKSGGLIVQGDKIAQDDILEHWNSLKEQVDAFEVFRTTEYPELQLEWTKHYLADDRIRLTESEQQDLLRAAGCSEPTFQGRWRMDALFSGVKG
jgi:tRNA (cmo5U34)-methyltransferase